MPALTQIRRATSGVLDSVLSAEGEIRMDLTKKTLRLFDGTTLGGISLAREDLDNVPAASSGSAGKMTASQVNELTAATSAINTLSSTLSDYTGVAFSASNVTLSSAQLAHMTFEATGTLTADVQMIFPDTARIAIIKNSTSGSYTLTVKNVSGTGVTVPQGQTTWLYCSGTEMYKVGMQPENNIAFSGNNTFSGSASISGAVSIYGPQTETLTTDTDDLTINATTNNLEISLTGDQSLTGITGGTNGRIMVLRNTDDTDTLTLTHEDTDSTAANRFALPSDTDLTLAPGESVLLQYSASRWRTIANASTGTGPTGAEIGTVSFFASGTGPLGWLPLSGTAVLRSSYPDLDEFVYVGDADNATASAFYHCTDAGDPDGTRSTTGDYLYLPDTRGNALRALDGGRGVDVGRVLGSEQLDQMQQITGTLSNDATTTFGAVINQASGALSIEDAVGTHFAQRTTGSNTNGHTIHLDSSDSPGARVGDETRMRNTAFPLFIKAFYPVPVTVPSATGVNINGDLMLGELRGPDAVSDDGYVTKQQMEAALAVHLQSMKLQHQEVSGTNGGAATAGSRQVRKLNASVVNTISGASHDDVANTFTLPVGTYEISSKQLFNYTGAIRSVIWSTSGDTVEETGLSQRVHAAGGLSSMFVPQVILLTLTQTTVMHLGYECQYTRADDGVGQASNLTSNEIYAEVYIRRLA